MTTSASSSVKRMAGAAVLLGVLYVAWPLWSGWQLRQAVKSRDLAALETLVDWPLLRANLKPKLAAAIDDSAARSGTISGVLKRALGGLVTGPAVNTLVTPANLGRLLAGRAFVLEKVPSLTREAKPESAPAAGTPPAPASSGDDDEDVDDPVPPRRLRWAFFESPTRFRIEALHPKLAPNRVAAILALQGWRWQLVDIEIVRR